MCVFDTQAGTHEKTILVLFFLLLLDTLPVLLSRPRALNNENETSRNFENICVLLSNVFGVVVVVVLLC